MAKPCGIVGRDGMSVLWRTCGVIGRDCIIGLIAAAEDARRAPLFGGAPAFIRTAGAKLGPAGLKCTADDRENCCGAPLYMA